MSGLGDHVRRRALIAALALAGAAQLVSGQVSGTWTGQAGTSWWGDGANWTSDPLYPTDGGAATFTDAGERVNVNVPVSLSSLTFQGLAGTSLHGSGLTFTGPAVINTLGDGAGADNPTTLLWTRHTLRFAHAFTAAGLVKNGPGTLRVVGDFAPYHPFSHPVTVNGGTLMFDKAFTLGNAGSTITLSNGGALRFERDVPDFGTPIAFAAPIVLQGTGGVLDVSEVNSASCTGPITGSGGLDIITHFAPFSPGPNANHTGPTRVIGGGTAGMFLSGSSALPKTSALHVASWLQLDGGANRIADAAPLTLRRAFVTAGTSAGAIDETFGTLTLAGGETDFRVSVGVPSSARFTSPGLVRQNRATLDLGVGRLGEPLAAGGATQIHVGNASSYLVGGGGPAGSTSVSIIPFIINSHGAGGGLVTNSPGTGLRSLTDAELSTALPTGVSQQNVRLAAPTTIAAPVTVNALVLAGGATLSGAAPLTVTSGLVRADSTITAPLNFATAEGIIRGSTINVSGPISGSGGLTVVAAGDIRLTGANTYTGQTTINGGVLHLSGNTQPNVPGQFGVSDTTIVVAGDHGFGRPEGFGGVVITGAGTLARGVVIAGDPRDQFATYLKVTSNTTLAGDVVLNGPLTSVDSNVTISGRISGAGPFVIGRGELGGFDAVRLRGANAHTGGTFLEGDGVMFNNNAAFGTGPIVAGSRFDVTDVGRMAGDGTAALTIDNPVVVLTKLAIGTAPGAPLTLTGAVNLNGGTATLGTWTGTFGASTGNVTIAGRIGNGTLVYAGGGDGTVALGLSNNDNRQWANVITGGTLRVEAGRALGRSPAFTEIRPLGTLALAGDISVTPHPLRLDPGAAMRNIAGSNAWRGTVSMGTFGGGSGSVTFAVDSGALALRGDLAANSTATLVKVGPGVLELKRIVNQQASVGVALNGGELRLTPDGSNGGVSVLRSLSIVGGADAPAARFDLADNGVVIYANAGTFVNDVAAYVRSAHNGPGGAWTGNGITTSMGDAGHGVGYGLGSAIFGAGGGTFMGIAVDANTVMLRLTRYGDANLDGTVTLQDFNRLAANFGQSGKFWHHGDFNYDGTITLQDFNRLAANFGQSAAGPTVTPEDWSNLAAAVPEPATIAGLGPLVWLALRRRVSQR